MPPTRTAHGGHKAQVDECCELVQGYRRSDRNVDGSHEDKLWKKNEGENGSDLYSCKLCTSDLCKQEPNYFAVYIKGKRNGGKAEPGDVLNSWKTSDPCSEEQSAF